MVTNDSDWCITSTPTPTIYGAQEKRLEQSACQIMLKRYKDRAKSHKVTDILSFYAVSWLLERVMKANRRIKHDFPFINICKVPREVLKTEGEARGFQFALGFQPSRGTLRMLMNDKIMFDRYKIA